MVIVDTTIWIDYLGGGETAHTNWLHREIGKQRVALTDLNLCEVLQGVRNDEVFRDVRSTLLRFKVFSTAGTDLAVLAAGNYRTLRARGFNVRTTIDCLIATFCIEAGHTLLHRDPDFDVFERELGLRVVKTSD